MLFGIAGSGRVTQLLKYQFEIPEHRPSMSAREYMGSAFTQALRELFQVNGYLKQKDGYDSFGASFLVGYQGMLFHVEDDFQAGLCQRGFDAVGIGRSEALAVMTFAKSLKMAPKAVLTAALKTVEETNIGVKRPFKILEI